MDKTIGTVTRNTGTEHAYLIGYQVKIIAVIVGGADPEIEPDDVEILRTDEEVAAAGGVQVTDRVEVVPWIEDKDGGRWSFVTSDPRAIDLAAFHHLTKGR